MFKAAATCYQINYLQEIAIIYHIPWSNLNLSLLPLRFPFSSPGLSSPLPIFLFSPSPVNFFCVRVLTRVCVNNKGNMSWNSQLREWKFDAHIVIHPYEKLQSEVFWIVQVQGFYLRYVQVQGFYLTKILSARGAFSLPPSFLYLDVVIFDYTLIWILILPFICYIILIYLFLYLIFYKL